MRLFTGLVNLSVLLTLIVICLGAYTRLTDAGLGCPDWPGCYGSLQIPHTQAHIAAAQERFPGALVEPHKARNEMIHRYVAGGLGIAIAAIFFCSLWFKQQRLLSSSLLLLVILQAGLGMLTVTLNLFPLVVVAHLLGGFSLFALLVTLRLNMAQSNLGVSGSGLLRLRPLAYGALGVLLLQVILGGWTSANYAALVCHQLPWCEAGWQARFSPSAAVYLPLHHESYEYGVMPYEARMTIHVLHRMGALLSLVLVGSFAVLAWHRAQQRLARRLALALASLLLLQIALGLTNVLAHLPLWSALAHNLIAANLLMVAWLWAYQLHRGVRLELKRETQITSLRGLYGNH